jgi:4-hydroxy-2-oxoheptanedioate aldolase
MKKSAKELVRNEVKEKLGRNELVLSMAVRLVRTVEIASIASAAGFDSLYIDLEHNSFSLDTAGQICMAALAAGVTPFVRVPSHEQIPRVLDGGALGVIAPHIESAADALQIVRAAKFPPLGDRSIAGNLPHFGFRTLPAADVVKVLNEATMVVVMIESGDALKAVEEIASVDGVDILFIGTNDLCASLGIPGQLDHDLVLEAYRQCAQACRRNGKHLGIGGLAGHPELTAQLIQLGARYVSTGTDLSFLLSAATAKVKQMLEL